MGRLVQIGSCATTNMKITPAEDDVMTSLRSLLLSVVPDAEVIQGQENFSPLPLGRSIVMTIISATALIVPVRTYDGATANHTQGKEYRIQLDTYGHGASDVCSALAVVFRSTIATEFFDAQQIDVQTLFAGEPRNMQFINESNNYEDRWSLDVHLQVNQTVSAPVQSATQLAVGLREIDTHL